MRILVKGTGETDGRSASLKNPTFKEPKNPSEGPQNLATACTSRPEEFNRLYFVMSYLFTNLHTYVVYLLTDLLTPWSRIPLEKMTDS
jgi:hypothetical protein